MKLGRKSMKYSPTSLFQHKLREQRRIPAQSYNISTIRHHTPTFATFTGLTHEPTARQILKCMQRSTKARGWRGRDDDGWRAGLGEVTLPLIYVAARTPRNDAPHLPLTEQIDSTASLLPSHSNTANNKRLCTLCIVAFMCVLHFSQFIILTCFSISRNCL